MPSTSKNRRARKVKPAPTKAKAKPRTPAKAKLKAKVGAKAKTRARAKARPASKPRARRSIAVAWDRGRNEGLKVEYALSLASEAATRGLTRGADGAPSIGVQKVPADQWGDGYSLFRIRSDLVDAYDAVRERVTASGGVITSSGGLRAVTEPATPGRSKTSLHYTARAIDLNVSSGMQGRATPYIVVRDGGSEEHPLWKIYCEVNDEGGEGATLTLQALTWRKGQEPAVKPREVRCICITDMMEEGGWQRIPARSGWKSDYMCCEWWHFQNQIGLVTGVSLFGDELKKVWPADDVDASGLALNAVWGNQSFIAQ
jgi:hypothetical protein